jgi:hypothetical protein
MPPIYRYTRGVGRAVIKAVITDTKPGVGEMIALPGKKHRTYRAPITLDSSNKPVRTPLTAVSRKSRKRQPQSQQTDWITIFGGLVKGE